MDRLDSMGLFTRVVERRSFTAAANDLGIPRSTATEVMKQLEKRLGVRLLQRTTRHVSPTQDGEAFYERCRAILSEVEEAEGAFSHAQPSGVLRVDAPGMLTRTFLVPKLAAFMERYPKLQLQLGQGERIVDLVREGVDCVIRVGTPSEPGLVMKRLGQLDEITCASPAYLKKYGRPKTLDDLSRHFAIGFLSSRTHEVLPFEFVVNGKIELVKMASRVTVNNADTAADLAREGLGLIQAPRYRFDGDLAAGTLIEVLPKNRPTPTPVVALYPQHRQLSPRVRAFVDWTTELFALR